LGEIERVCEHLVEIAGGRLVRSVPMSTLTRATGLLIVEVDGEIDPLDAHLRKQGLSVTRDGRILLVSEDGGGDRGGDGVHDKIRDAVVDLDLGLVRLEPARGRLEDIFQARATEQEPADA
jgi:ABC-2 type transport system ATP-binding protein